MKAVVNPSAVPSEPRLTAKRVLHWNSLRPSAPREPLCRGTCVCPLSHPSAVLAPFMMARPVLRLSLLGVPLVLRLSRGPASLKTHRTVRREPSSTASIVSPRCLRTVLLARGLTAVAALLSSSLPAALVLLTTAVVSRVLLPAPLTPASTMASVSHRSPPSVKAEL